MPRDVTGGPAAAVAISEILPNSAKYASLSGVGNRVKDAAAAVIVVCSLRGQVPLAEREGYKHPPVAFACTPAVSSKRQPCEESPVCEF